MATMKDLRANLKRGVKVVIRDTYSKDKLHDKQVFVASHGLVECKQKGIVPLIANALVNRCSSHLTTAVSRLTDLRLAGARARIRSA